MASRIEPSTGSHHQGPAHLARKAEPAMKKGLLPSEASQLFEYLFEASDAGRSQVVLNSLNLAANARGEMLDRLSEWVEAAAKAHAVRLLRAFIESPPQPEPRQILRPVHARALPANVQEDTLEPFFRAKHEQQVLRQKLPNQRRRWALYFERFGCIACGEKKRLHAGCGFCERCYARIRQRLKSTDRDERSSR